MVGAQVLGSVISRTRVATRLVGRGGLATVAAVLVYAAVAAQPAQAKVSCGDVITEDTKLHRDLHCSGNALEIDADDVTLDLNGHTIKGDGGAGILVGGQSGVKIKNGTVTGFNNAIVLDGTDDSTVRQINAKDNIRGIGVQNGSDHNTIERNKTNGNSQVGIDLTESDSNRVKQNTANGNGDGVDLNFGNSNTIVEENTTNGNDNDGVLVDGSTDTTLRANHADDNGDDGIDVDASDSGTSIGDNRANDNGDLGIEADPGTDDAGGNRAHGNGDPQQCTGVSCS
jgi:parallel beta-helix repeat protein